MGRKDAELFREEEDGSYKYIGDYYRFRLNGTDMSRRKRVFVCLAAAAAVDFLVIGRTNSPVTRFFAAELPFAASFLPLCLLLVGTLNTLRHPERMTYLQYKSGPRRIIRSAIGLAVTSALALIGAAVKVFMSGLFPGDAQFIIGAAAMCLLPAAVIVLYNACPAEKSV